MTLRRTCWIAALLVAAGWLGACSPSASPDSSGASGGTETTGAGDTAPRSGPEDAPRRGDATLPADDAPDDAGRAHPSMEHGSDRPDGGRAGTAPDSASSRPRRRMDVDQLDAALRRVSGGIGWTRGEVDKFDELEHTLGKPDYVESTREDLSPDPVFQKFLADAARDVCTDLARRERRQLREGTSDDRRHLFIHAGLNDTYQNAPDSIDANLRALLLRFHGQHVENESSRLANWRRLFRRALEVGSPFKAWRTVCVALVRHPHFYTY